MAELHPQRVGEALVARQLAAVIGLDAVAGERERVERAPVAGRICGLDLGGRDLEAAGGEIEAIMLAGQLDERRVAVLGHVGQDGAHHRFDVGRSLALGGQKGAEALGKIGRARVEADRHGSGSAPPGPASGRGHPDISVVAHRREAAVKAWRRDDPGRGHSDQLVKISMRAPAEAS